MSSFNELRISPLACRFRVLAQYLLAADARAGDVSWCRPQLCLHVVWNSVSHVFITRMATEVLSSSSFVYFYIHIFLYIFCLYSFIYFMFFGLLFVIKIPSPKPSINRDPMSILEYNCIF